MYVLRVHHIVVVAVVMVGWQCFSLVEWFVIRLVCLFVRFSSEKSNAVSYLTHSWWAAWFTWLLASTVYIYIRLVRMAFFSVLLQYAFNNICSSQLIWRHSNFYFLIFLLYCLSLSIAVVARHRHLCFFYFRFAFHPSDMILTAFFRLLRPACFTQKWKREREKIPTNKAYGFMLSVLHHFTLFCCYVQFAMCCVRCEFVCIYLS